jgi:hypothetical protein
MLHLEDSVRYRFYELRVFRLTFSTVRSSIEIAIFEHESLDQYIDLLLWSIHVQLAEPF